MFGPRKKGGGDGEKGMMKETKTFFRTTSHFGKQLLRESNRCQLARR